MSRALLVFAVVALLQGCAYLQVHVAQVALVGTVAGAVAASEQAIVNGLELKDKIVK